MTHWWAVPLGLLFVASTAPAQNQTHDTTSARATGLSKKIQWKFNFDAGVGAFGFGNSLYTDARPDPSGDLGDDWVESFAKPALSAEYALRTGALYGAASVVGERTFAAPPSIVGEDASSFQVEDMYIGWKSGKALSIGEDALDFRVGRSQYRIGHGFLLWDGGGEGGSRGGYWSNARKAWEFAGIARFKPKNHTFEAFYLDRDEVPEAKTGTQVWGANYDLAMGEANTIGATYLGLISDSLLNDHEDNLFLHGWGLANEPVYDQQATAYLFRDNAKATIKAFYSMMAGGFSHGVYEPVEHRWRWGQYFGPPSTDGAWFAPVRLNTTLSALPNSSPATPVR